MLPRSLATLLLVLLALPACSDDEPVAAPPPGHGGSAVRDSDADRSCAQAAPDRTLTGSSSVTLAEVVTLSGAQDPLAGSPFGGLPPEHRFTACFYNDGRTYTSLLVDDEGRLADNPAAPSRPVASGG